MKLSSFFSSSPSKEEVSEFNHFFYTDVLGAQLDSYNRGYGPKKEFDFLNPSRFVPKEAHFHHSLLSGIQSRELKGHGMTDIRMFQYNVSSEEHYSSAIMTVDTADDVARLFLLSDYMGDCRIYRADGSALFEPFMENDIADKRFFAQYISELIRFERRYLSLTHPTSDLIRRNLPLKGGAAPSRINLREVIRNSSFESEKSSAELSKMLKVRVSPKIHHKLLCNAYTDDSGLFYIRPLRNCILILCRKGFDDTETLGKIRWLLRNPFVEEEFNRSGINTILFTDMFTGLHDFINYKEIDPARL